MQKGIDQAIKTENDTYYTFIMTSFDEQADPYLKNNKSIIKGMELYYKEKNENGRIRRLQTIECIEALRGAIFRIIHKIFQKNNSIYDQKIY